MRILFYKNLNFSKKKNNNNYDHFHLTGNCKLKTIFKLKKNKNIVENMKF